VWNFSSVLWYLNSTGGSVINATGLSDETLAALVLTGDTQAFAPLVERHQRGVVNFIHASVRSAEDANDLSQETFMRAYAHLRTFNPDLGKFSTWLYQIARNVARTHLGKEGRRPPTEDLYEDETIEQRIPDTRRDAAPDASLIAGEDEALVRSALTHIPEKMRAALALRYFNHLEYQEIADTMQVTLGNVKTLIHRGKAALARELAQDHPTGLIGAGAQQEIRGRELLSL